MSTTTYATGARELELIGERMFLQAAIAAATDADDLPRTLNLTAAFVGNMTRQAQEHEEPPLDESWELLRNGHDLKREAQKIRLPGIAAPLTNLASALSSLAFALAERQVAALRATTPRQAPLVEGAV